MRVTARIVYGIFSALHLGPLFFYSLIGLIVHLIWNVMEIGIVFKIYHVFAGLLIVYAVVATICSVLGIKKRRQRRKEEKKSMQIVNTKDSEMNKQAEELVPQIAVAKKQEDSQDFEEEIDYDKIKKVKYPIVSRVKQNPKYVMAEYPDRYELYYQTQKGYRYIKTDYKRSDS